MTPKIGSRSIPTTPASANSDRYEVRCYRCDVAYPVGTKRCIHCGQRTGVPAMFMPQLSGGAIDYGQPSEVSGTGSQTVRPIDFEDEEDETESRGTSIARVLGNLSWIILFVAITVYRSCAG